jgi:hypothetical protein
VELHALTVLPPRETPLHRTLMSSKTGLDVAEKMKVSALAIFN